MNTNVLHGLGRKRDFGSVAEEAPIAAPASAITGALHIVSVGVANYPIDALKLRYPAKDAEDICEILEAQADRLYRSVNPELLQNERATKRNILNALEKVAESCDAEDTLLLYMAGHGALHLKTKLYYFLPYDVNPQEMMLSAVAGHDFSTVLGRIPGRRLVILDTCNAGSVLPNGTFGNIRSLEQEQHRQPSPKLIAEALVHDVIPSRAPSRLAANEEEVMAVLAATRKTQAAFEPLNKENGLFTHFVIEGLRGAADSSGTGEITLTGLFDYVSKKVRDEADGEQEPTLSTIGSSTRVVVARGPFGARTTATVPHFTPENSGVQADMQSGEGSVISEPTKPSSAPRDPQIADGGASMEGETIGEYVIAKRLGRDTDTTLYLARRQGQDADTVLFRWLDRNRSRESEARDRFYQAARTLRHIDHPHVAKLRGEGLFKGAYVILEAAGGQLLSTLLSEDAPGEPVASALQTLRDLVAAVQAVHAVGMVHLALRPERILIGAEGTASLLDSPLMQAPGQITLPVPRSEASDDLYLAPECRGQPAQASEKSDVYALGAIGQRLFAGQPETAEWQQVLANMQAPDPSARPTMAEVVARLQSLSDSSTTGFAVGCPARLFAALPIRRLIALVASAALLLVLGVLVVSRLLGNQPKSDPPLRPTPVASVKPAAEQVVAPPVLVPAPTPTADAAKPTKDAPPIVTEPDMIQLPGGQSATARVVPYFLDRTEVRSAVFADWLNTQPGLKIDGETVRDGNGRVLLNLNLRYGTLVYVGNTFHSRPGMERKPVVQVSFEAARQFCRAQRKRLPWDSEWELAAHGAALDRPFPWGDKAPRCDGVIAGRAGQGECVGRLADSRDVASASQDRTPEGVLDLAGNVAEWVNLRATSQNQMTHQARGGDWARPVTAWTQALTLKPESLGASLGFRCAKDVPASGVGKGEAR